MQPQPLPLVLVVLILFLALLGLGVAAYIFTSLCRPWLRAFASGTPIAIVQILGMRLRGNPPDLIVAAYTSLAFAGDGVPVHELESAYIANRGLIRDAQDLIEIVRQNAAVPNLQD